MSTTCNITFDNNPLGIYYAGQVVSGTAELITTRPKTIRSIFITVSGYAEVRWTENITKQNAEGKSETAIETYSSHEMYYSSEKYVYGQSGGSQLELPAGKYAFPFQATISPNAPTSFNGAWGQIQHEVSLIIDRVMRYNNIFKQPFSLISPYDLNLNPENAKPLQHIEEKTFCWTMCCGNKGPMVMKVNVPFSAYAPGQKIRFNIVLDNQTDMGCSDVKVRLMKKVTYTSHSPTTKTKETEVKVADNHCGEVVKLNKAEFNEFLQLPSTTPTSLQSCSIIKVNYSLKFIAKVSRIFGDLVIEFPLVLGTVPLYASANDQGPITSQPGVGPTYRPLPPPMFEEDVRSEQFESNLFKPRYPVFLSDGDKGNASAGNKVPPPANSLYPSVMPAPGPMPHSTPQPSPNPVPTQNPTPVPIPFSAPPPTPPTSSGPAPTQNPTPVTIPFSAPPPTPPVLSGPYPNQNISQPSTEPREGFQVLGFSIPPDYQPTPSAPNRDGWK